MSASKQDDWGKACVGALLLSAAPLASAQQDLGVDEVVVTARKVEERVLDIPSGISAINREALEAKQVNGMSDLNKIVPSLTIYDAVTQNNMNVVMRGVATVQGAEPSVAVIVDGVQSPSSNFLARDLADAESIQVLRGPQGALYGRGAIAGAIVIETKRPTNFFSGDARVYAGSGDDYRASATAAGPIVDDKLLFKVSGSYNHFGGLLRNIGNGAYSDYYESHSGRAELLYTPTDTTRISLIGDYLGSEGTGVDWSVVGRSQLTDYSIKPDYNLGETERRFTRSFVLRIDQETSFGTFTSITQNARAHDRSYGDGDYTNQPVLYFDTTVDTKAWNQDLRYTSPQHDVFNWMLGAFYQPRKQSNPLVVPGDPAGPFSGMTLLNSHQYDESDAYAAYGQARVTLPSGWELSLALRHDIEKRHQVDRNSPEASEIRADFSAFQPQASISKKFSRDFVGYVSYGEGFRSGGFNAYADTLVVRPGAPYPVERKYPSEQTRNYEIGFKSQFLDRTVGLNVSAYYMEFQDQQYFFFFPATDTAGPARDIITVPESVVTGLEVEGYWEVNGSLKFDFSGALTDPKVKSDAYHDNYLTFVVLDTLNLGGQYEIGLSGAMDLVLRADYQRLGKVYYDIQNTYSHGATNLLNASAMLRWGNYEIGLQAKNLLDEIRIKNFNPDGSGPDFSLRSRTQGTTFGVEARAKF